MIQTVFGVDSDAEELRRHVEKVEGLKRLLARSSGYALDNHRFPKKALRIEGEFFASRGFLHKTPSQCFTKARVPKQLLILFSAAIMSHSIWRICRN